MPIIGASICIISAGTPPGNMPRICSGSAASRSSGDRFARSVPDICELITLLIDVAMGSTMRRQAGMVPSSHSARLQARGSEVEAGNVVA